MKKSLVFVLFLAVFGLTGCSMGIAEKREAALTEVSNLELPLDDIRKIRERIIEASSNDVIDGIVVDSKIRADEYAARVKAEKDRAEKDKQEAEQRKQDFQEGQKREEEKKRRDDEAKLKDSVDRAEIVKATLPQMTCWIKSKSVPESYPENQGFVLQADGSVKWGSEARKLVSSQMYFEIKSWEVTLDRDHPGAMPNVQFTAVEGITKSSEVSGAKDADGKLLPPKEAYKDFIALTNYSSSLLCKR